jgi:elongator complex protein 1
LTSTTEDKTLHLTPLPDFMVPPPLSHIQAVFNATIRNYSIDKDSALIETIESKLFLVQFGFPDDHRIIPLEDSLFRVEDEEDEESQMITKLIYLKNLSENSCFEENEENGEWKEQEYMMIRVRTNLKDTDQAEEVKICKFRLSAGNNKEPEANKLTIGGEESDSLTRLIPDVLMCSKVEIESFQVIQKLKLMPSNEDGSNLVLFTNQNSMLNVFIPNDIEDPLDEVEEGEMLEEEVKYIDWVYNKQDDVIMPVYINDNDTLYLGSQKLADDVTSFILNEEFLLYTMNTQIPYDHLFTQKLSQIRKKTHAKTQSNRSSTNIDWRVRNIEKGAKLVCTGNDKIILQMPRGNLESIFSRIFLLQTIAKLVSQENYSKAFALLRKHKMSLSLLVDLDANRFKKFIENGRILKELKPKQLNLLVVEFNNKFASELSFLFDEDELNKRSEESLKIWGEQKVNNLCKTLLDQLQNEEFSRVKDEMVVFSKTEPPSLIEGLTRIKNLKLLGEKKNDNLLSHLKNQRGRAPHSSNHLFDEKGKIKGSGDLSKQDTGMRVKSYKEVLKYFCWLVDAEELFRESLLMFDLEMAVMVAEFTQKDPKDYLPYIEALKRLEDPLQRKVRICRDLTKDTEALNQIYKFFEKKEINEKYKKVIVDIVQDCDLHAKGLEIFGADDELNRTIRELLAKKMIKGKDQKGAAEMYLSFENYEKALECFEKVLDWRNCLGVLKLIHKKSENGSDLIEKQKNFLEKMKPKFEKLKSYKELSEIATFLQEDPLKIAEILLRGHLFKDCKRVLTENDLPKSAKSPEDIESFRRELLLQSSVKNNHHLELLGNLKKWKKRLKIIKKDKRQKLEMIAQGIIPEDMEGSEHLSMFSQTTAQSSSSAFSILTGLGLSGNKRRGKKPKNLIRRKVKEGSVYEEEWLAQSINAMELTFEEEKEVEHLLSLLVRMGEIKQAREILKEYRVVKVAVENKGVVKTVLQEEFEKDNVEVFEIYSHIKEFDSQEISKGSKQIKPVNVLKKFEYLMR